MSSSTSRLRDIRNEWARLRQSAAPGPRAPLRVALLATYTVDPMIPYLGTFAHRADLAAEFQVAPFNQIVQQCVDDDSVTAAWRPDVLVVSPRLEELWAGLGLPTADTRQDFLDEALLMVDAAASAAARWNARLVFVIPPMPEDDFGGLLDDCDPHGVAATADLVRRDVRERLARHPNIVVVDLERLIRSIGTKSATEPSLFRYAKVPYTEELFARTADHIVRGLRLERGPSRCRAMVLDMDSLVTRADDPSDIACLNPLLLRITRAGLPVALRGARGSETQVEARLALSAPGLMSESVPTSFDDAPPAGQLKALARRLKLDVSQIAYVTSDADAVEHLGSDYWHDRGVLLGEESEFWPRELLSSPALDGYFAADRTPGPVPETQPPVSLADYVAGLGTIVALRPLGDLDAGWLRGMLSRTQDFSIADRPLLGEELDGQRCESYAVSVWDRFGHHGESGALRLVHGKGELAVDVFLLSCPVMGKGVEELLLKEVIGRALARAAEHVVFHCARTDRNEAGIRFLTDLAGRAFPISVEVHHHD